jgi:glucose-6-phosphate dehydrogenase assembly protein OpcA
VLTLESLAGDESQEVKFGELESKLAQLGRAKMKEHQGAEATITRAASLTLVVLVETPEAAQEVSKQICAISEQNPCRAVILVAQPEAKPSGLRAWISVHFNQPSSSPAKRLCAEQILVEARGSAVNDLGSAVLPLTLSGLPVHFWWRTARFDPPDYFRQVFRLTSRVLLDSARFLHPEVDLLELAGHVERQSAQFSFQDLNWSRITPWRELISQCFDRPETRGYLDRLERVRIEYESESPRLAAQGVQALLIAGWLAGRLQWQPAARPSKKQDGTSSFYLRAPHGEVEVQRVARLFEGAGKGVCFWITLEAGGDPPASFKLDRGCDGRSVETRAEIVGRPLVTRTVRLEVLDEAELVNEELQISGRDPIFEESLSIVARCLQT